jgi:hypothetical protein
MCVAQPYITGGTVEVEATNTSPVPVLPRIGPLKPVTESSSPLPKIVGKGKKK